MLVFVINKNGEVLMPCSNRKARILLKEKKAKVVNYKPFTIQLIYGSSGYKQETNLGIDIGSKHIGIAVTSENTVLMKGQIDLRQDISKLLETRKMIRRSRRSRKTRYRQARFLNRKKPEDWLPPSIQSRIDNTIMWITKFKNLLPRCTLALEVGKFDIQKIENPNIERKEYQQGTLYEYRNRIAYLIAREKGKCQFCGEPYEKGDGWRLHHIWGKSKDRPQDWALLHKKCHEELHANDLEKTLRKQKSKSYKESTFMNIIRKRLFSFFVDARFTYGNITFQDRCNLNLKKSHYNDAVAITGIKTIKENSDSIFFINQFRKKKRSLHEATARKGRKTKNVLSTRNSKNTKESNGFYLNDKVRLFDKIGFISGFTSGGCYVKDVFGKYITIVGKSYKQVSFKFLEVLEHNNNWQFIPHLKEGDFLPEKG
jgi:hypothetical protein